MRDWGGRGGRAGAWDRGWQSGGEGRLAPVAFGLPLRSGSGPEAGAEPLSDLGRPHKKLTREQANQVAWNKDGGRSAPAEVGLNSGWTPPGGLRKMLGVNCPPGSGLAEGAES